MACPVGSTSSLSRAIASLPMPHNRPLNRRAKARSPGIALAAKLWNAKKLRVAEVDEVAFLDSFHCSRGSPRI